MGSITPTGVPAWVHTNDHTAYGGDVNKENYAGERSVDAQTDFNAAELCRVAADLEALARVAPFATITYTQDDSGLNDPTIDAYDAMAGTDPTLTRQSDGVVQLAWETKYEDPYGVEGDIHIAHVEATVAGAVGAYATWIPWDLNADGKVEAVRVCCWDHAGNPILDTTVTVTVTTSVG